MYHRAIRRLDPRSRHYRLLSFVPRANRVAFWPLWDVRGTQAVDLSGNGYHGTHTNVVKGTPGLDGLSAAYYNGSNALTDVYSAGLASRFSGAEGSLGLSCKVSGAAIWTDGVRHMLMVLAADANNQVNLSKHTTNNTIRMERIGGGTAEAVNAGSQSSVDWLRIVMTWSESGDVARLFVNGAQAGSDQTGLGAFAGSLASVTCVIGANNTTPTLLWSGWIKDAFVSNVPLTPAQVATDYLLSLRG